MSEAVHHFTLALELDPRSPETVFNLALALMGSERPTQALAVLEKHPAESADYHALKGAVYNALGRPPDAAQSLRGAVRLDPKNPDTLYDLAVTLMKIGAGAEAADRLQRARVRFPQVAKIHAAAGMAAYLAGNNEQAMGAYETAVKLEPDAADLQAALGDVYHAVGELAKADAAYSRALRIDASVAAYFVKRGRNLAKLQQPREAELAFQNAVARQPGNADAHFELGKLAAGRSSHDAALAHFERAVSADPALKAAWYQLSLAYRRAGRQDESASAMKKFQTLQ